VADRVAEDGLFPGFCNDKAGANTLLARSRQLQVIEEKNLAAPESGSGKTAIAEKLVRCLGGRD